MKSSLILLIFLVSCSKVSFNIENDVVGKTDSNFTNGAELRVEVDSKNVNEKIDKNFPSGRILESDPKTTEKYVFGLRQDMYTPYDITIKEIIPEQNPYAGSLTVDGEKILSSEKTKIATKIRIGTSGWPSLAGETQTFVHDTMTDLGQKQKHPEGWHNQVSTQPLVNFDWQRTVEHFRVGKEIQFAGESETSARLGNIHTDATGKLGIKYGYNLPTPNSEQEKEIRIYAGNSSFLSLVAHNLYFDGGLLRDSVHTVDSSPTIIGLVNYIGISYGKYALKFSHIIKTEDYENQPESTHSFGILTFGTDW